MNILVPHKWLLDHLKTKAKPTQIQEYLSLSGPSVENIIEQNSDQVYDIEITTNRPDSLSIKGVAREAVVILNRNSIPSELKSTDAKINLKLETEELPLPKIDNSQGLCQRITCIVLDQVQAKPSPKWMQQRLEQAGFQTHDCLIDITNYVTHDLGHPCHAFDYDKIMDLGGVINVVEAKAGQPFVTLDQIKRETVGGEIIFTNEVGTIIDFPAIIGTANSSVDNNTKRVLLWLEDLDPQKVRTASMAHSIRTVAAQLNEKELDPYLAKETLTKAISLFQEIAGAKIASKIFDDFNKPHAPKPIKLKYQTCSKYLGIELEVYQIKAILTDLGCQVKLSSKTKNPTEIEFTVTPPTFRPDLQIPVDLIEEIARIYGYHNIPNKLMSGQLPTNPPQDNDFEMENNLKTFLANIGWQELYSISLVSQELAKQSGFLLDNHLQLNNPLLTENQYLRRSLIPSLREAVAQNPQESQLSFFEIAAVYHPQKGDLPQEKMMLGMISTKSYRKTRGDFETLLTKLFIDQVLIEEDEIKKEKNNNKYLQVGKIFAGNNTTLLGQIAIFSNQQIAIEIELDSLLKLAKKHPTYQSIANTSIIIEDLTFNLPLTTQVGEVIKCLEAVDSIVVEVLLKDHYQQNFTFQISYQDPLQNLSNELIAPIRKKIVEEVENKTDAKLVGKV